MRRPLTHKGAWLVWVSVLFLVFQPFQPLTCAEANRAAKPPTGAAADGSPHGPITSLPLNEPTEGPTSRLIREWYQYFSDPLDPWTLTVVGAFVALYFANRTRNSFLGDERRQRKELIERVDRVIRTLRDNNPKGELRSLMGRIGTLIDDLDVQTRELRTLKNDSEKRLGRQFENEAEMTRFLKEKPQPFKKKHKLYFANTWLPKWHEASQRELETSTRIAESYNRFVDVANNILPPNVDRFSQIHVFGTDPTQDLRDSGTFTMDGGIFTSPGIRNRAQNMKETVAKNCRSFFEAITSKRPLSHRNRDRVTVAKQVFPEDAHLMNKRWWNAGLFASFATATSGFYAWHQASEGTTPLEKEMKRRHIYQQHRIIYYNTLGGQVNSDEGKTLLGPFLDATIISLHKNKEKIATSIATNGGDKLSPDVKQDVLDQLSDADSIRLFTLAALPNAAKASWGGDTKLPDILEKLSIEDDVAKEKFVEMMLRHFYPELLNLSLIGQTPIGTNAFDYVDNDITAELVESTLIEIKKQKIKAPQYYVPTVPISEHNR